MYAEGAAASTGAAGNEQLLMYLKLQGSAAQVLATYVNESANKRKKMEEADVLHHIEECRRREDIMIQLEKNTNTMYLPMLFGVPDSDAGLHITLSNRAIQGHRNTAAGQGDEEQPSCEEIAEPRCSYGALIPEIGPIPEQTWEQYTCISQQKIATLLLATNNPMFSLSSEINPYPEQCLREVLPGASMIVRPTFELLCQMADTLLTEALVRICWSKLDDGADVLSDPISAADARAGLRALDKNHKPLTISS